MIFLEKKFIEPIYRLSSVMLDETEKNTLSAELIRALKNTSGFIYKTKKVQDNHSILNLCFLTYLAKYSSEVLDFATPILATYLASSEEESETELLHYLLLLQTTLKTAKTVTAVLSKSKKIKKTADGLYEKLSYKGLKEFSKKDSLNAANILPTLVSTIGLALKESSKFLGKETIPYLKEFLAISDQARKLSNTIKYFLSVDLEFRTDMIT